MNPSTRCAVTLLDALAAQGVADIVVCPGSRSAALAYAAQDADRAGRVRLHVRVDERSAGFLALGLARASGRPVPVVTTSGTAVANLHPAVLEAHHGGVPLLVLSADRPPELRGTGANQTTDQVHLFGGAVRWSHDLGTPADGDDPRVWRAVAARACAAARGTLGSAPGPVHLNLPMREPLVPDLDAEGPPAGGAGAGQHAQGGPAPLVRAPEQAAGLGPVIEAVIGPAIGPVIEDEPRTLLVLGDLPAERAAEAVELATARGWPVVAEPFGRFDRRSVVGCGSLVLTATDWVEQHRPARVLVAGRPTLSRAVASLLRDGRTAVDVVTSGAQWSDPGSLARTVYPWGSLRATSKAQHPAGEAAGAHPGDDSWRAEWQAAGDAVAGAVAGLVRASWPSGPAVAATLASALPDGATLFAGSSNPVRDLDLALAGQPGLAGVTVLGNRGLAGIDGCVSSAVGIALATAGPAYAVMGDLTFLHDANGLLIGPAEPRPDLTVVVVNDDGGGIFALLEPGEPARAAGFERVFGTPTGASLQALCAAHGVRYLHAPDPETLAGAVREPPRGLRVVEVPVDRAAHRHLQQRLREAAAAALAPS